MEITEIEETYGELIFDDSINIEDYVENEEDYFDISAVRMIRRNIAIMNELVLEEYGEINDDGEFYFYSTDGYVTRWRAWGFKLSWNKLQVNFDSDFAITFSIIFLILNIINEVETLIDTINAINNNDELITEVILEAFYYLPIDIASTMVAFFSSEILGYLTNFGGWITDILTSANITRKVFQILISILLPSISDCIIVLYYALSEYSSINLGLCWIPTWKDKWGFSIKLL